MIIELFFKQLTMMNIAIISKHIQIIQWVVENSAWNGFHTFFLPTDKAFAKVGKILSGHSMDKLIVTIIMKRGEKAIHYKVLSKCFQKEVKKLFAVSEVYERYSQFRRGAVWAKVLVPNIPVQNGVVKYGLNNGRSYEMLRNLQLRYALDPWQVLTPEQNFTFFVPTNEAWDKVSPSYLMSYYKINYSFVIYTYSIIPYIVANVYTDFELFWPRGNRVARVIEGGEIAGMNRLLISIITVPAIFKNQRF
uniref:SERPIN domain-containing protein n=1 Tax=Heterorhabditis bacteriophora TaxID=37862 RepID=A0A1I7X4S7_HETBA